MYKHTFTHIHILTHLHTQIHECTQDDHTSGAGLAQGLSSQSPEPQIEYQLPQGACLSSVYLYVCLCLCICVYVCANVCI